ncbi:MAG: HAD family hydrolase [Sporomusaceae bacterium]|nr:HAD family hydrolase [Sporomusaceae bacterium]
MNILFWDIDGTLIRTAKAGLIAFDQAVNELWGKSISFEGIRTAGMTDHYISEQIIRRITGKEPSYEETVHLTTTYERFLAAQLAVREGRIMPSVIDILEALGKKANYEMLLLTGNTMTGADIKLNHFKLAKYFNFDHSAFCNCFSNRDDIAAHALAQMKKHYGHHESLQFFVIGDTPNDVSCGKSIGAKTIAIATGNYALHELEACDPWWAVETLPSPAEFEAKLNSAD